MTPKSLFASKTFWFNMAAAVLAAVLKYLGEAPLDPMTLMIVTAVINIVLRYITNRPVVL